MQKTRVHVRELESSVQAGLVHLGTGGRPGAASPQSLPSWSRLDLLSFFSIAPGKDFGRLSEELGH